MKIFLILPILTLLVSCDTETETVQNFFVSSSDTRKWLTSSLPLNVKIEDGFYDTVSEADTTDHTRMMSTLNDAYDSGTFFIDAGTLPQTDNTDSNSYQDTEIGIYKGNPWHGDFSSGALAICQYFIQQVNVGLDSYFIQIIHGDIFLNFEHYQFTSNELDPNRFDLPTVLLHELGHLVGLQHNNNFNSFMYKSLGTSNVKREPLSSDVSTINDIYPSSALLAGLSSDNSAQAETKIKNRGKIFKGVIELFPSGDCIHKLDGIEIERHKVKL